MTQRKAFDIEEAFNEYFFELESYCLRAERFYDSLDAFTSKQALAASMVLWLRTAFERGAKAGARDACNALDDYATACAGLSDVKYTSEGAFDVARENLEAYYPICAAVLQP